MPRYIDADVAYEIARTEHKDFAQSMADLTSLREVLEDTPTADVVEVKHGEWIERRGQSYLVRPMKFDVNGEPILQDYISYVCSCCGRTERNTEPYCHCGAKMSKSPTGSERKDT